MRIMLLLVSRLGSIQMNQFSPSHEAGERDGEERLERLIEARHSGCQRDPDWRSYRCHCQSLHVSFVDLICFLC